ncbi:uncharacterized protein LOC124408319 [Diprion similis]|uniref:uncharacterized protein LOC124408319 n=1 Tax=Diprion similis TaxID=362088 RepID=UPI001EF8B67F|nr:uncharacterized protein LOC124408319 [Diprion similis]
MKMNSTLKEGGNKHSTPVLCQKNLELYFPLSEIRPGDTSTLRNAIYSDSDDGEKKSKQTRRRRRIQNTKSYTKPDKINSSSDSEYETFHESEINCSDNEEQITSVLHKRIENFFESTQPDTSVKITQVVITSPRPGELFYSPEQDIGKHYGGSLNSHFDHFSVSPPRLQYWNSPKFQRKFQDPKQYKSYSGPGRKERLSPSKISFSPKWANPVPSKYSSPSQIPPVVCAQPKTSPIYETRRATSGSDSKHSHWNRCKTLKAPFPEKKKRVERVNRKIGEKTYDSKKPVKVFSEESCRSVSMIPVGTRKQSDKRKLPIQSGIHTSCVNLLSGSPLQKTSKIDQRHRTADENHRGESLNNDSSSSSSESITSRPPKSAVKVRSNIKITDGRYENFFKKLYSKLD